MYTPEMFKSTDTALSHQLIRDFPFATLITPGSEEMNITHLPLLLREEQGRFFLVGHMARANPQWKIMEGRECIAIFHGPHTYITPSWYQNEENVPTWNYAVVHVHVRAKLVHNDEILRADLFELVSVNEKKYGTAWSMDSLPKEFIGSLSRGIVGFHMEVIKMESKFKMSQNRVAEDRQGVIDGLLSREDEQSQKVLEWMKTR